MKRKIVKIDREKCDGCGLCVSACHEAAIQLVDGKAELVSDIYCDGLGDCLSECPRDAITIEERDAPDFDPAAVDARVKKLGRDTVSHHPAGGGCPGMKAFALPQKEAKSESETAAPIQSELQQWPVQLHLVPVQAPYWQDADLLLAADCVSVACPNWQRQLLRGRKVAIACPKLDDTSTYVDKLAAIFANNEIASITVAHMEVPCCTGILRMAEAALQQCGKAIPFKSFTITIGGDINPDE